LGIGDWAQSPIPNPQSPIPNPQSPLKVSIIIYSLLLLNYIKLKSKKIIPKLIYKISKWI
jgi:hypothetical protein